MTWTSIILAYLDKQNKLRLWLVVVISMLGLGIINYFVGYEFSFSFFYLFPISLASWTLGKTAGQFISLVCVILWEAINLILGQQYSSPWVLIGNAIVRAGFYLVISTLIVEVRSLLKIESHLSRTDYLTGILNRRAFYEASSRELQRLESTANPLTMIYMDLDDFKITNDTFGHKAGDELLRQISQVLRLQLRGGDIISRMGGDEFAILLPETNMEAARLVVQRVLNALRTEMQERQYPVTFSIGSLTCITAPPSVDEMLHIADQLMYDAKRDGKNMVRQAEYHLRPTGQSPIKIS